MVNKFRIRIRVALHERAGDEGTFWDAGHILYLNQRWSYKYMQIKISALYSML